MNVSIFERKTIAPTLLGHFLDYFFLLHSYSNSYLFLKIMLMYVILCLKKIPQFVNKLADFVEILK